MKDAISKNLDNGIQALLPNCAIKHKLNKNLNNHFKVILNIQGGYIIQKKFGFSLTE